MIPQKCPRCSQTIYVDPTTRINCHTCPHQFHSVENCDRFKGDTSITCPLCGVTMNPCVFITLPELTYPQVKGRICDAAHAVFKGTHRVTNDVIKTFVLVLEGNLSRHFRFTPLTDGQTDLIVSQVINQ